MPGGEPSTVEEWVTQVNKDLHHMRHSPVELETEYLEKRSIYKVPQRVIDLNPKAYKPQVVSFGPYHHDEPHLLLMEEHKHGALLRLLKRCEKRVDNFISVLDDVASDLMTSYYPLDHKWKEDNFVKMMLLDGCFMLEILRSAVSSGEDYSPKDPIFSFHATFHNMRYILTDMLMLENQLPMLVLDKILSVETDGKQDEEYIYRLILSIFGCPNFNIHQMGKRRHLLDVFRKSLLLGLLTSYPTLNYPTERTMVTTGVELIPSATELDQAGIKFEISNNIKFNCGILGLPRLIVDDSTESEFLNLIAYERAHIGLQNLVTSYIIFMQNIMVSEKDVMLLQSRGVIKIVIKSEKAVAEMFNRLPKGAILDWTNYLHGALTKEVIDHCRKPWNKWRAILIRTYFANPWTILSLLVAIFFFALTIVQTVCAVISVKK